MTTPLRRLLAAYREAVKLTDSNHDDAYTGAAKNAIIEAERAEQRLQVAVAERNELAARLRILATRSAELVRMLKATGRAPDCFTLLGLAEADALLQRLDPRERATAQAILDNVRGQGIPLAYSRAPFVDVIGVDVGGND